MSDLRALTVKQPWTWAILHGKPVENRSWPSPHWLTEVAIHAGARSGWDEDGEFSPLVREAWKRGGYLAAHLAQDSEWITFGAIVAVAEGLSSHRARDCAGYCSKWAAEGQWHWVWRTLRVLPEPVPCRGAQRLWIPPEPVESAVRAQLGEK